MLLSGLGMGIRYAGRVAVRDGVSVEVAVGWSLRRWPLCWRPYVHGGVLSFVAMSAWSGWATTPVVEVSNQNEWSRRAMVVICWEPLREGRKHVAACVRRP